MDWTLSGTHGWWPTLSYPWVAHGVRAVFVSNVETGESYQVPGVDGYPHGWMDAGTLRCTQFAGSDDVRQVFDLAVPSWQTTVDPTVWQGLMEVRASRGHWAAWDEASQIWYDGRVIDSGCRSVRQQGEWVATKRDGVGVSVYIAGVPDRTIPQHVEAHDFAVLGAGPLAGTVVYGYPRVVAAYPGGTQRHVSRSPWGEGASGGGGMCLVDLEGTAWLWTCGLVAPDRWAVIGGPLNDIAVLVLDMPAIYVHAQYRDGVWYVAANDEVGHLRVMSIEADAPRTPIVEPEGPPSQSASPSVSGSASASASGSRSASASPSRSGSSSPSASPSAGPPPYEPWWLRLWKWWRGRQGNA